MQAPHYRRKLKVVADDAFDVPPGRRWQMADLDDWMTERMIHRWGGTAAQWKGKLPSLAASNTHMFVTNEHAVMLATVMPHPMTNKPVVHEIFAWARDADLRDDVYSSLPDTLGAAALLELYWRLHEWGKSMGATRKYVGFCSDFLPSTIMKGVVDDGYYIVGAPC